MEDRFRTWHLVQVSDGLDSVAVEFLEKVNVWFYRPLMRTYKPVPSKSLSRAQRKSPLRRMREKIEPLFPGYAFVDYVEAGDRWREVFRIAHIRGLTSTNGMPAAVSWELINGLRQREVDGAVPSGVKLKEFAFAVGERIRVTDGPFASFAGTVTHVPSMEGVDWENVTLDQLDESVRLEILVDIFGRQTPVSLSLSQVEQAAQPY